MNLIAIPNKNIYNLTSVNDNCIGGGENLRKFSILVATLLIFSGFAAVGFSKEASDLEEFSLSFSTPEIIETTIQGNDFIELKMEGANAVIHNSGEPILPIYTKTINLPFGTKLTDITYDLGEVKTIDLSDKIIPAPSPVLKDGKEHEAEYVMNEAIYNSDVLYPEAWYSIHTGAGLNENSEHTNFLTVQVYPVRYNPIKNQILYIGDIDITINLDIPEDTPFTANEDFDMVVIAPSKLYDNSLQALIDHKNEMGVKTMVKVLSEIYSEYQGYDEPEQIKYYIKYAVETLGVKYVLLVGGLDSLINAKPKDGPNKGVRDWLLPVRYTNLHDSGGTYDPGFISDLYYADIYDSEGGFSSWDSNGDGLYANWKFGGGKDVVDLYPDVYVGRLACRNVWEVKIITNKIINYEKDTFGQSWYDKMILVGGDSFPDTGTNYVEGEVATEAIYNQFMSDFSPVRIYASYKNSNPTKTPTQQNLIREITAGSGHMFFDGHSYPGGWATHYPGEFDEWVDSFDVYEFFMLNNGGMLPVCCVEGCHNSMFNVSTVQTMLELIPDYENFMWCHGAPVPECWSWWMTRTIGGGSIATIGNTGLGYGETGERGDLDGNGVNDPDCIEALGGFWFYNFYKTWAEGKDILGEIWAGAETKYLNVYPANEDQSDTKTVEQLCILGDPSLKIGGYPSLNDLRANINDAAAGIEVSVGSQLHLKASAKNGMVPYTFEWDFDEDGQYDDASGSEAIFSCDKTGIYQISLKVTDADNNEDIYSTVIGVEPTRTTPKKPSGPTQISKDTTYTYSTNIDAENSATVLYNFSWGDGTYSDWSESATASHSWNKEGTFKIKVKSMMITETSVIETDWSDPLAVTISKSRTSENLFILLLQRLMERFPILERIFQPFFDI